MVIKIRDINEVANAARQFVESMGNHKVFAFRGEMGVGKTTLIREICRCLGVDVEDAASPTFSIINEYQGTETVYHFDFYRIENEEEGEETGAADYFDSGKVCFVEWPERVEGLLPDDTVDVVITEDYADGSRSVELKL